MREKIETFLIYGPMVAVILLILVVAGLGCKKQECFRFSNNVVLPPEPKNSIWMLVTVTPTPWVIPAITNCSEWEWGSSSGAFSNLYPTPIRKERVEFPTIPCVVERTSFLDGSVAWHSYRYTPTPTKEAK